METRKSCAHIDHSQLDPLYHILQYYAGIIIMEQSQIHNIGVDDKGGLTGGGLHGDSLV